MSEDYSFGSFLKQRSVLGDLSNHRNGKRGLPLNPGSYTLEKIKGHRKNVEGLEKDKLPSWVYIGQESLDKGKENVGPMLTVSENAADGVDKSLLFLKAKRLCHSLDLDNGDASNQEIVVSDESKEAPSSFNCELHPMSGNNVTLGTLEGEGSRDSYMSSSSLHAKSEKARDSLHVLENLSAADGAKEGSVTHAFEKNKNGKYGQFFALSASDFERMDSQLSSMAVDAIPSQESVNNLNSTAPSSSKVADAMPIQESMNISSSTMPSSSKVADVNFNASTYSHGRFTTNDSSNLEKACSCSFCVKAAYLLSDLQYQDFKGRIAALSKSTRHARLLVKNYSHDEMQKAARGSSNPKLEFDLLNQWKSLFHHTEDILVRETAQLQSSLLSLNELRRNCERDLEIAIRMHPGKP